MASRSPASALSSRPGTLRWSPPTRPPPRRWPSASTTSCPPRSWAPPRPRRMQARPLRRRARRSPSSSPRPCARTCPGRSRRSAPRRRSSTVALRPHFDATVDKVLVADGAEVKAGDVLIHARRPPGRRRSSPAPRRSSPRTRRSSNRTQRDVTRYTDLVVALGDAGPQSRQRQDRRRDHQGRDPRRQGRDRQPARSQLGWYTVTAPISGRVGVVNIKEGNIAKAGDNSAAGVLRDHQPDLADLCRVLGHARRCCRRCARRWRTAPKVVATPQGSKAGSKGKLAILDNAVDPTTGTIVVRALFDNADERLWPGQLCDLTLTIARSSRTPSSCRARRSRSAQSGNFVFTVADGVAHVRPSRPAAPRTTRPSSPRA